jgi:hypothetical protein
VIPDASEKQLPANDQELRRLAEKLDIAYHNFTNPSRVVAGIGGMGRNPLFLFTSIGGVGQRVYIRANFTGNQTKSNGRRFVRNGALNSNCFDSHCP